MQENALLISGVHVNLALYDRGSEYIYLKVRLTLTLVTLYTRLIILSDYFLKMPSSSFSLSLGLPETVHSLNKGKSCFK